MDKNDIIEYVMNTPHNTNRAVLSSMLNQLAEGGGGGGSSDFSTAEVTFINSADSTTKYFVTFPECDDAGDESALIMSQREITGGTPVTVTIPLYKGLMVLNTMYYLQSTDQGVTPTFSGDVSLAGPYILITGDGSITFAGTGGAN